MRPELESHLLKPRSEVRSQKKNPMIYSGFSSVGSKIVSLSAFLFGPWNVVNIHLSFLFHIFFHLFCVCVHQTINYRSCFFVSTLLIVV